jgi:hypothetical protein
MKTMSRMYGKTRATGKKTRKKTSKVRRRPLHERASPKSVRQSHKHTVLFFDDRKENFHQSHKMCPCVKTQHVTGRGLSVPTLRALLKGKRDGSMNHIRHLVFDWDCTLSKHPGLERTAETPWTKWFGTAQRAALVKQVLQAWKGQAFVLTAQSDGISIRQVLRKMGISGMRVISERERHGRSKTQYLKSRFRHDCRVCPHNKAAKK